MNREDFLRGRMPDLYTQRVLEFLKSIFTKYETVLKSSLGEDFKKLFNQPVGQSFSLSGAADDQRFINKMYSFYLHDLDDDDFDKFKEVLLKK